MRARRKERRVSPQTETEPGLLSGTLRGTNQSGMRAQNERLVLTLLRRNGSLAKAEIARLNVQLRRAQGQQKLAPPQS